MRSIKFFLIIVLGLIFAGGVGYWLYQVFQGESVTVMECMIGEKAPQKIYAKMKSTGAKPLEISKISVSGINYTLLENVVVPPGTVVAILIPDAYAGGRVSLKTLEGEEATGDGVSVVVEGTWPEDVDHNQPFDPSLYYGVTIYGSEDKELWTSISVNVAPELPDP